MKRIIELPDDVVTAIQNGEDYRYDIHTAIAQGTPYEEISQCDLISRSALKKYARVVFDKDLGRLIVVDVSDIDKAPPAHDRQQGKWIIVKDEKWGDNVKCPFCGKELAGTDLNFCCKCGAQMKGGLE